MDQFVPKSLGNLRPVESTWPPAETIAPPLQPSFIPCQSSRALLSLTTFRRLKSFTSITSAVIMIITIISTNFIPCTLASSSSSSNDLNYENDIELLVSLRRLQSHHRSSFRRLNVMAQDEDDDQLQMDAEAKDDQFYEGDDLIYSGSGCFDDEDKCTGFTELGSGDDLITPVYIPPKSSTPSTLSPQHTTTPVSEEEERDCTDDEEDCIDGSGSGEPLPPASSTERSVISSFSTTTVWTTWTSPSYVRPMPQPEEPIIDYEEPVPRTPRPMPPPLPLPPRPYPTTKLRLPTRPTGTPPIIDVPLPEMPSTVGKEKQKPTPITHKSSADTTAMIIGLIAIVLIVIVIVTPLFLFLKVRYRTGTAYKTDDGGGGSKNFRFLPVSGTPPLLNSSSQQTHLAGALLESSNVEKGQKVSKKKDLKEWYV